MVLRRRIYSVRWLAGVLVALKLLKLLYEFSVYRFRFDNFNLLTNPVNFSRLLSNGHCDYYRTKAMLKRFELFESLIKTGKLRNFEALLGTQRNVVKIVVENGVLSSVTCPSRNCNPSQVRFVELILRQLFTEIFRRVGDIEFFFNLRDTPLSSFSKRVDKLIAKDLESEEHVPDHCDSEHRPIYEKSLRVNGWIGNNPPLYPHPLPVFSPSILPGCSGDILSPSFYYDFLQIQNCRVVSPWASKKSVFFWRGTPMGGLKKYWTRSNFRSGFRQRMVLWLSQEKLLKADVGFFRVAKCREKTDCSFFQNYWANQSLMKPPKMLCMHQKFKYLLDIDGRGWSARFPYLVSLGSLVLRYNDFYGWADDFLIPDRHYVKLPWLTLGETSAFLSRIPNQEEAERIAEEGAAVARRLQSTGALCYWYWLLLEYKRIFGKPTNFHD